MFLILPDGSAQDPVVYSADQVLFRHPSGAPWIVGRTGPREPVSGRSGRVHIVVIGDSDATTAGLDHLAARTTSVHALDHVKDAVRGSFFLIVSADGHTRAQGSLAGTHELFHHRSRRGAVLADSAAMLADRAGAPFDRGYFALRLCGSGAPPPLDELTPWSGVRSLPGHSYAVLAPSGDLTVGRWWRCPEADTTLSTTAARVRDEVEAAVALRCGSTVTADLSGGLDSTVLALLADSHGHDITTVKWADSDAVNTDERWTARLRERFAGEHLRLGDGHEGQMYSGVAAAASPDLDAPFPSTRTVERFRVLFATARRLGASTHFGGYGGDELFTGPPSYLHTTVRHHPALAATHIRTFQALRRWRRADVVRALADRAELGRQLREEAESLRDGHRRARGAPKPRFGWSPSFRLPPWATDETHDLLRGLLLGAAETAEPLAPERSQHATLSALTVSGRMVASVNRLFGHGETQLCAPYTDARVVEAALSTTAHERGSPLAYKPLLREAFDDMLTGFDRADKGVSADQAQSGLSTYADSLAAEFAPSVLGAELGLVDDRSLRRHLEDRSRYDDVQGWFDPAISSEMFLRGHGKEVT